MLHRSAMRLAAVGTAYSLSNVYSYADMQFDTKGFSQYQSTVGTLSFPQPLMLSGAGMRRKNLYVMEVDVYLAAIHLTPTALSNARSWKKNNSSGSVADAILTGNVKSAAPQAKAVVTLRFVRDVGVSSLNGAFNEILAGLPQDVITNFTDQVRAIASENGVKKGEDLFFVWMEGGGMKLVGSGIVASVDNPQVERKLLDGYLDIERGVSPELRKSFHQFLLS
mmetsp:Transcript_25368/g.37414  ORF Transcript_25368/g.37414 Transcript_25368/m.37414 type:complete len:223 (+) Transcript_25368:139-807(+)